MIIKISLFIELPDFKPFIGVPEIAIEADHSE